jgi:excisionase family DNA binding protein
MRIELESENLLSMEEAIKELGITRITLYRWIWKGKIASAKFGNYRAIPKEEVERLKNES